MYINHLSIILPEIFWKNYYPTLFEFIKLGKYAILETDPVFEEEIVLDAVKEYRKKYKDKEYFTKPRFDKVGITTNLPQQRLCGNKHTRIYEKIYCQFSLQGQELYSLRKRR